jgi:hypothetical protein
MIDRLQELADRPLVASERRRLFTLVIAVLVGVAIGLALLGQPAVHHREQPTATRTPTSARVRTPMPAPSPNTRAETAARRFLDGYLAYLYGQGPAGAIDAASHALRHRLQVGRPRVSPAMRRRHGRVVELDAHPVDGTERVAVTATIDDGGVARYPISLTLQRRADGFLVVEVGAE